MSRRVVILATVIFVLGVAMATDALAQAGGPEGGANKEESVRSVTVLTIHGKVAAVNESKKLVTLEANGKKVTFRVENPYNLKTAKTGEPVVVRYFEVVSIRKKRPGEAVPAVSLREGIATARAGVPGAVAEQSASALVSVAAVDLKKGMVSIKGPDGSVEEVKARDPRNLRHVKAGDELVVTVTRATAIAVEKDTAP
jgi:hypothetical protein